MKKELFIFLLLFLYLINFNFCKKDDVDNKTVNNKPTIEIVTSIIEASVDDIVTISAILRDDKQISKVKLLYSVWNIDTIITIEEVSKEYHFTYDLKIPNKAEIGEHIVKIIAFDNENASTEDIVRINVSNIKYPIINIITPTNNSHIKPGTDFILKFTVTEKNTDINKVYVNSKELNLNDSIEELNTKTYTYQKTINVPTLTTGQIVTIDIVAINTNNQQNTSTLSLIINNLCPTFTNVSPSEVLKISPNESFSISFDVEDTVGLKSISLSNKYLEINENENIPSNTTSYSYSKDFTIPALVESKENFIEITAINVNDAPMTVQVQVHILYTNPVFEPVLADPSIVKAPDGYFYAFGTEDNWGDGTIRYIPIIKSKNLVDWAYVGSAFDAKPSWKPEGFLWAPDILYYNGVYYLYYAISLWGDPDPGIGVATSSTPSESFTDQGKLFLSSEIGVNNSIDPFVFIDITTKYLLWGSFHGIYGVELNNDLLSYKPETKFQLAGNLYEAAYIYYKNGFYYFFGSVGSCCEGANSTYNVKIARASSLKGDFLDKNGNNIKNNGGTSFIQSSVKIAGPGHNANIITDDNGDDWFVYHAIQKDNPLLPNGASRRALFIDKIKWTVDGWPYIEDGKPSYQPTDTPFFSID